MPTYTLDETNPSDAYLVPNYPALERAFRAAVKGFLEVEHVAGEGRHKFGVGTTAARDAITTWEEGSIWFSESVSAGEWVLQVYENSLWRDVAPSTNIPRLNRQSLFTANQFTSIETVTPGAGTPNTLAVDLDAPAFKTATLTAASTILSNPVSALGSGNATSVQFEIKQDGTGGRLLTFDSNYRAVGSVAPPISLGADEITVLHISSLPSNLFLVQSSPAIGVIP